MCILCLWRPEKRCQIPKIGVTCSCESPNVGALNWTLVLCKSRMHSLQPPHLTSLSQFQWLPWPYQSLGLHPQNSLPTVHRSDLALAWSPWYYNVSLPQLQWKPHSTERACFMPAPLSSSVWSYSSISGARYWIQDLAHAWQALHHWAAPSALNTLPYQDTFPLYNGLVRQRSSLVLQK